ncbi:vWA domain-containing protein [Pseudomonas sp. NPDC086581]|uniref:vWA domain-containing protein n=1 Tax=Pseudomonas sp. NPDC086581 TaxID=3364432 RepID=UPI0038007815
MWQFDYPWLLLAAPLPWLAWRCLPEYREVRLALRIPFFTAIATTLGQRSRPLSDGASRWQLPLNLLVWGLLLIALARPVWVDKPLQRTVPLRDLMLAIDISQSMETRDFSDRSGARTDRLSAVKRVVKGFIQHRQDDRLGLILFGTAAFAQAPLTMDHASLKLLLDEADVGMAGPNTAIGDAIGLAIRQFEHSTATDKVLILLTDGSDNGSAVAPLRAAQMAAQHGIRVHCIGIGDPNTSGEEKVDFEALRQIADATGGQLLRAQDSQALEQVYASLDRMTPRHVATLIRQPRHDLFWLPLGGALLALLLGHSLAALAGARARSDRWT